MTVLNNEDPADPSVHEPSYAGLPEPRMWYDHATQRCSGMAPIYGTNEPLWDASDMRAAIAAERAKADDALKEAREKQRMLTDHAVRVDTEAFKGNIDALSKLDLDAMDAQPLLLAVQNWDISTGRARELLRCWVLGTFKPDMLPECGDDLFEEAEEPRTAWRTLRAEADALRAALQPFADTDLTNPLVRDTFGFDVLRARAALQNHSRKDHAS